MTTNQINMIIALSKCTFLPGSFSKRFAKDMLARAALKPDSPLTEKQSKYLAELFHKYRKQIGHVDHVCFCELCNKAVDAIQETLNL